jgi:hypothetical protein
MGCSNHRVAASPFVDLAYACDLTHRKLDRLSRYFSVVIADPEESGKKVAKVFPRPPANELDGGTTKQSPPQEFLKNGS